MNRPDSTSKNMLKNAELKLPSCGLQKKLRLRNCGVVVASNMSVKSCGIAITEVLPSSCGIAIADSKKSCACPPLINTTVWKFEANYTKMAQKEKTLFENASSI
jgi:hypothetical protein